MHGSVKKIVPVLKNPDTPERSNCPPLDKKFFKRPAKKGSKYTARKKGRSTLIPTFDRLFVVCFFKFYFCLFDCSFAASSAVVRAIAGKNNDELVTRDEENLLTRYQLPLAPFCSLPVSQSRYALRKIMRKACGGGRFICFIF